VSSAAAALVFSTLTMLAVGFQLAVAAGLPWGALTWGGRFPGRLPISMRAVAVISALLLSAFALVVAVRAGILWPRWDPASRVLVWVVVGYCALGVVANTATPSKSERQLWLPVVLLMLASSLLVAVG
jgi:hypothetical protein